MLHVGLNNKPEFNLTNADIEGTKTQIVKFQTSRAPSNPLNPVYKLPSFTYVPPEPLRFIRDAMLVDDIDGTKPLVKKEFAPRDTLNIFDIQGAQRKPRYERNQTGVEGYDNIHYTDVTKKSWQTKRQTNPLEPTYAVWDRTLGEFGRQPDEKGQLNEGYGVIDGSKPAALPQPRAGVRNLNTQDIAGAKSDTRRLGAFTWMDRRQVRPHNKNDDIEGSQPDTLKRGLNGKRVIDPLDPSYFYPGGTENINTANDPYGLKNCTMSQANFRQAS